MIDEKYSEDIVIEKVKNAKELMGYRTNKQLIEAFNKEFKLDIEKKLVKSLNKDFLFRLFSKKIKSPLSNKRFAKICEFLKIDIEETRIDIKFSKAAYMVDELIKEKPELENQIYSVIKSITNLSKGVRT